MLKKLKFKKLILFLFIPLVVYSCKKDSTANDSSSIPIGTTVKLEVSAAAGQRPIVQYWDAQQNIVSIVSSTNNWSTTFQTTRSNQFISLTVNGSTSSLTGKIYINGSLKKEASGNLITLIYP